MNSKSFEYICAAASATTLLIEFSSRLVEFNRSAQSVNGDSSDVRCKMFDLSFLLLSRIAYWFGFNPVTVQQFTLDGNSSAFLDKCCDWGEVCWTVPSLGNAILKGIKEKELHENQMLKIFDTLQTDVCGLVLCLAQWLGCQETSDERRILALSLQNFLDAAPTTSDHRRSFMSSTVKKVLVPILQTKTIPSPAYPWLINCGRHQLPQLGLADLPEADHLRQGFIYALRQGWACSGVLSLVEKSQNFNDSHTWTKSWVEEMMKLISVDEMSMACEMFLGVSFLFPAVSLVSLCKLVMEFVMENGHELYCVAPRGTVLFMVHAFILAFQLEGFLDNHGSRTLVGYSTTSTASASSSNVGAMESSESRVNVENGSSNAMDVQNGKSEEPRAKMRKMELATENGRTNNPEVALKSLYSKFTDLCEDGEVRPAVYFVASFLRVLSENTNTAAKKMISLLPLPLLHQVIRIDPKIISAPTVLALHNLEERTSRQRALQNLCLLRQLRAL